MQRWPKRAQRFDLRRAVLHLPKCQMQGLKMHARHSQRTGGSRSGGLQARQRPVGLVQSTQRDAVNQPIKIALCLVTQCGLHIITRDHARLGLFIAHALKQNQPLQFALNNAAIRGQSRT